MTDSYNESDDRELLMRKIAKCDRLLKKRAGKTSARDLHVCQQLQNKRADYIHRLGELTYRSSLEQSFSSLLLDSPNCVTERLDSSQILSEVANWNDSLAIFEASAANLEMANLEEETESEEKAPSKSNASGDTEPAESRGDNLGAVPPPPSVEETPKGPGKTLLEYLTPLSPADIVLNYLDQTLQRDHGVAGMPEENPKEDTPESTAKQATC